MGPRPLRWKHRILNTELLTLKKHGLPQGSAGKSRICYLNWDLEEVCLSAQAAMIKYQVLGGFNRNWFSHNLGTGGLRPELECGRLLERALLLACRWPFLAVSSHGGGKEQAVLGLPLFCSDAQSCPILCDPMACSTPGSSVPTVSCSLLKLKSIESVMPSNPLILCRPLLLLLSILPSIRVFSIELACHIRWPKYWSFSFSIRPSNDC